MKILLKTICEDAHHNRENGNLNIIGIFEDIKARDFPAVHPKMSFVFILEGKPLTDFEYHFVDVVDPKGTKIFDGKDKHKGKGSIGPNGRSHITMNLMSLKIENEGAHKVNIKIGELEETINFNVVKLK